jgi:hypothetical protein
MEWNGSESCFKISGCPESFKNKLFSPGNSSVSMIIPGVAARMAQNSHLKASQFSRALQQDPCISFIKDNLFQTAETSAPHAVLMVGIMSVICL